MKTTAFFTAIAIAQYSDLGMGAMAILATAGVLVAVLVGNASERLSVARMQARI